MKSPERILIPIIVIALITALGCYYILNEYNRQQVQITRGSGAPSNTTEDGEEEEVVSSKELKYESIAILVGKDEANKNLTFDSIDLNKRIQLDYDETTRIYGKHGNSMSLDQLMLGEVLDVSYSIHSGIINTLTISSEAWTQTGITRFEINERARSIKIADSLYKMDDSVIVSYGDKLANLIDITNVDTLTVKGQGRRICSIIVEKGHGYLRLENDSYFVDGWVEVGQEIIKPITERMLLPVPEGEYHLRVSNKGYAGEEDIVINRDKETKVDLSKIDIKEVAIGHVAFTIEPDYALLYIDDALVDFDDRVALEYGVHNVHVESAGYEDADMNIRVASEFADVDIVLDRSSDNTSSSTKTSSSTFSTNMDTSSSSTAFVQAPATSSTATFGGTTSSTAYATSMWSSSSSSLLSGTPASSTVTQYIYMNSSSSSSTSSSSSSSTSSSVAEGDSSSSNTSYIIGESNVLYVESPRDSQVYIDGIYVGVAPTGCIKPTGTHIVTFVKDGCIPKSYTVNIEDDGKDFTLSFSDLIQVY